ncbi:MAG TPA: site-specific integrase [Gemmatimonadales bacterium]
MASIKQLPSGLWRATVHTGRKLPSGNPEKIYETNVLRGVVKAWADEQERAIKMGDWIDPRGGTVTVGEWWERCKDSRRLELASRRRDESHWRCHVGPYWSHVPIGSILQPDVTTWTVGMERAGKGATTIEGSLNVLRGLLEAAVAARVIRDNPARGVHAPRRSAHLDRVLGPSEDIALLDACDRLFPDRPDARLIVELMLYCGLRWEEVGGLDREHVDLRRGLISVGPVLERDGTIRPYPKSPAGVREVTVDEDLWPRLRAHTMTVKPGGLLVTAPQGGRLDYVRWRVRVWLVLLHGKPARKGTRGHPPFPGVAGANLLDPQPTPHDLRHTYGTRLGEHNVPPHEIKAVMGHSSLAAAERYLHAGDGRHDRVRQAMKRARMS